MKINLEFDPREDLQIAAVVVTALQGLDITEPAKPAAEPAPEPVKEEAPKPKRTRRAPAKKAEPEPELEEIPEPEPEPEPVKEEAPKPKRTRRAPAKKAETEPKAKAEEELDAKDPRFTLAHKVALDLNKFYKPIYQGIIKDMGKGLLVEMGLADRLEFLARAVEAIEENGIDLGYEIPGLNAAEDGEDEYV